MRDYKVRLGLAILDVFLDDCYRDNLSLNQKEALGYSLHNFRCQVWSWRCTSGRDDS